MDCSTFPISCELHRIANTLSQSTTEGFFETLLATMVGATVAAMVAWLVFRGEQKDRNRSRLIDATERVSVAMTKLAADFKKWQEAGPAKEEDNQGNLPPKGDGAPDGSGLDIGLEMLVARSRGQDKTTARQIREVAYQLRFIGDGGWASGEYATLRRVMIEWASTSVGNRATRKNLAVVHRRRAMKVADPTITEAELPPAPKRYEEVTVG